MRSSSQAAWKQSAARVEGEDSTTGNGKDGRQESHRGRRGDDDGVPPRGYGNGSSPTSYVAPTSYNSEGDFGAPTEGRRGGANGRGAVGAGAAGTRAIDPTIPLALGGAPFPPVAAAAPGKRLMVDNAVGGAGGLSSNDETLRKRYHAPAGNGDYAMGPNAMTGGSWQGANGGGMNQGSGSGPPLAPYPPSAMLPPPSMLRPLQLPAGRAQGARLMINGTHPAVPERRIHGIVSDHGVVGKIEVLEVRGISVNGSASLSFVVSFWLSSSPSTRFRQALSLPLSPVSAYTDFHARKTLSPTVEADAVRFSMDCSD